MVKMVSQLTKFFVPNVNKFKKQLVAAKIPYSVDYFVKVSVKVSLMLSALLTISVFFFVSKSVSFPWWGYIAVFIVFFFIFMVYRLNYPSFKIQKIKKELEKNVLFSARYILIKVESGVPLYNALIDASHSYGVSGDYFKDIVVMTETGTNIDDALEIARETNPSDKFKRILNQIITAKKTGAEIGQPLREVIDTISQEQLNEIRVYSKKLNVFILMYLIFVGVLPSIGIAMLVVIGSVLGFSFPSVFLNFSLFLFAFLQFLLISYVKMIRPVVNV